MNRLLQGASDFLAQLTGAGPLVRLLREWDLTHFDAYLGLRQAGADSVVRWDKLGSGFAPTG